jgi:hypothetical protein
LPLPLPLPLPHPIPIAYLHPFLCRPFFLFFYFLIRRYYNFSLSSNHTVISLQNGL